MDYLCSNYTTPLLNAVAYKHPAAVELLLKNGADPNKILEKSSHKFSTLEKAVKYGDISIVKLLIKYGALPDKNVLRASIAQRNFEIAAYLLNQGINIKTTFLFDIGASDFTNLLFDIAAIDFTKETITAEKTIALNAFIDLFFQKYQKNINFNKKNEYGNTALHYAARFQNIHLIKLLVDKGADVTIRNKDGYTALQMFEIYRNDYRGNAMPFTAEEKEVIEKLNYSVNNKRCLMM